MHDICHITSEYYFDIHSKEYLLGTLLHWGWGWGGELALYLPHVCTVY